MTGAEVPEAVRWHDLECGGYVEDLALWRALVDEHGGAGPVLDVGAGTGRVTLDLAQRGVEVVALDVDDELLGALRSRAVGAGVPVEAVCADARSFALGRAFRLVLVPMQTLQLLGGADARADFLRCAREHLVGGGVLAVALADALESFDAEVDRPPLPDMAEIDGVVWSSRPLAVVDEGDRAAIHRLREVVRRDGERVVSDDVVRLHRVAWDELVDEAEALGGWRGLPPRSIPQTDEYVGSTVVLLEAR
ncbi:class I SAM-dependent methyltransferase [Conexibacter sp. SYSU D00693]|uniref:class I SAM-dependent methyltransferase n=1 Tax=Conexibacter sp. SYSU D00693 TaxID=2812560 RepID=UPI00196B9AC2|nr:class I SAM-dependent methyltransferase [Conexibacter sp. SYSU D00693]